MSERILIGIYIGSSSASCTVMLSTRTDRMPTKISWGNGDQWTVPLRVSERDDGDTSFQWGFQADPTDSASLFGLWSFYDSESTYLPEGLVKILYEKRGKRYYHLPSSVYAAQPSASRAQINSFIDSLKKYVEDKLPKIYTEEARNMKKEVCVAIPPHLGPSSEHYFMNLLNDAFRDWPCKITFIPQVLASLLSLRSDKEPRMENDDLLLACHMEEEITTISAFAVVGDQPQIELKPITCSVLAIGAHDIADAFQNHVEYVLADHIAAELERTTVDTALDDLSKLRAHFLDTLYEREAAAPERFRLRRHRVTIDTYEMQEIFDPYLSLITTHMNGVISAAPGVIKTSHILLSGILGSCPYVHSFVMDKIHTKTIDSNDEAISPSQGAAIRLGSGGVIPGIRGGSVLRHESDGIIELGSRLACLKRRESALDTIYQQYVSSSPSWDTVSRFIYQLYIIWEERLTRQEIRSEMVKNTYQSIRGWLNCLRRTEDILALDQRVSALFAAFLPKYALSLDGYFDSTTLNDPARELHMLHGLHIAAALDEEFALQTMIDAKYPLEEKQAPPPLSGSHTVLDTCAWYGKKARCAEILLDTGGYPFAQSATRIAVRRGFFEFLELLQNRFPNRVGDDCPTLIYLAQLGKHRRIADWLLQLYPLYWLEAQPLTITDPLSGRVHQPADYSVPELQPQQFQRFELQARNSDNDKPGAGVVFTQKYSSTPSANYTPEIDLRNIIRWHLGGEQSQSNLNNIIDVNKIRESFLNTKGRSDQVWWADEKKAHGLLADSCIRLMSKQLKRDMCSVRTSNVSVEDIEPSRIDQCLTLELKYACQHWPMHVHLGGIVLCDEEQIHVFLRHHLLHWLEALVLIKENLRAFAVISTYVSMSAYLEDSRLHELLCIALRFTRDFQYMTQPLQIYESALLFAQEESITCRQFTNQIPGYVQPPPKMKQKWTYSKTLGGHSSTVFAVTFSPDSRRFASGGFDTTLKLWNTATGALQRTITGPPSRILAIAFAQDSRLLTSGTYDGTVQIWDADTGTLQRRYQLQVGNISSVAFSSDGLQLACGCEDKAVRLWDASTGTLLRTLRGHNRVISAVAFSPNNQCLASGSHDKTVRLWDTSTGKLGWTLKSDMSLVNAVTFCPNGQRLASSCFENKVWIWDVSNGMLQRTLDGQMGLVQSLAFSPDGHQLASGCMTEAVQLWDVNTGALEETFKGHTRDVTAVAFSEDGQWLAAGSCDCTVRLYSAVTAAATDAAPDAAPSVGIRNKLKSGKLLKFSWKKQS